MGTLCVIDNQPHKLDKGQIEALNILSGQVMNLLELRKSKLSLEKVIEQKKANFYRWNSEDNSLATLPMDGAFLEKTISWYEVADYLYTHNGLKTKN